MEITEYDTEREKKKKTPTFSRFRPNIAKRNDPLSYKAYPTSYITARSCSLLLLLLCVCVYSNNPMLLACVYIYEYIIKGVEYKNEKEEEEKKKERMECLQPHAI